MRLRRRMALPNDSLCVRSPLQNSCIAVERSDCVSNVSASDQQRGARGRFLRCARAYRRGGWRFRPKFAQARVEFAFVRISPLAHIATALGSSCKWRASDDLLSQKVQFALVAGRRHLARRRHLREYCRCHNCRRPFDVIPKLSRRRSLWACRHFFTCRFCVSSTNRKS